MIEKLLINLTERCQVTGDSRILVGVSGGTDSMALMDLLYKADYQVLVGHLDHGLRETSKQEAEFVRLEAGKRGLDFYLNRVDTALYSLEKKLSIEEAARRLRYEFLFGLADEKRCDTVAVAHTADDQAETVLLNLLRGTGLRGLSGMEFRSLTQWHSEIALIRPLLSIPKMALTAYCEERNIVTIEDESNQDTCIRRNRIRQELMPMLKEINPQLSIGLVRLAEILRGEEEILEGITEEKWKQLDSEITRDRVRFSRKKFQDYPRSLQRRLMRKALRMLRPEMRDIGFDHIELAIERVSQPPSKGKTDLVQGVWQRVGREEVVLGLWNGGEDLAGYPQLNRGEIIVIDAPGVIKISDGWQILTEADPGINLEVICKNKDRLTAYLPLEDFQTPLMVRSRKAGDRIDPLGMDGHETKVSDLMINEGIPLQARDRWPLLEFDGRIIWVPGCRVSESFKVTSESSRVIKISFVQTGN